MKMGLWGYPSPPNYIFIFGPLNSPYKKMKIDVHCLCINKPMMSLDLTALADLVNSQSNIRLHKV